MQFSVLQHRPVQCTSILYSLGYYSVLFTAVQLVFNPFSQLVPQLELYSQLQLILWSDPIAFSVSVCVS